jgi:hypothetical protein
MTDTLGHFARGFVGEGERHDAVSIYLALLDGVSNPPRDDTGLSRARASEHEQRAAAVYDRRRLRFIEIGEIHSRCSAW